MKGWNILQKSLQVRKKPPLVKTLSLARKKGDSQFWQVPLIWTLSCSPDLWLIQWGKRSADTREAFKRFDSGKKILKKARVSSYNRSIKAKYELISLTTPHYSIDFINYTTLTMGTCDQLFFFLVIHIIFHIYHIMFVHVSLHFQLWCIAPSRNTVQPSEYRPRHSTWQDKTAVQSFACSIKLSVMFFSYIGIHWRALAGCMHLNRKHFTLQYTHCGSISPKALGL